MAMLAQVMILLAGLLPNPQVTTDTTGIFLSICSLAYMAPLGLASAASTRVANALGARRCAAPALPTYQILQQPRAIPAATRCPHSANHPWRPFWGQSPFNG